MCCPRIVSSHRVWLPIQRGFAALARPGGISDYLPMLATASKLIVTRLVAWLAVGMLLLPSTPSSGCTCTSTFAARASRCCGHKCTPSARPAARGSCCSQRSRHACCAAVKRSCRSQQRQCCGHGSVAVAHGSSDTACPASASTTCSCRSTCPCRLSQPVERTPVVPVAPGRNPVERMQAVLATSLACAHTDVLSGSQPVDRHFQPVTAGTSLDRCIELSRFTC
jgi:hypothetical protein